MTKNDSSENCPIGQNFVAKIFIIWDEMLLRNYEVGQAWDSLEIAYISYQNYPNFKYFTTVTTKHTNPPNVMFSPYYLCMF